MYQNSLFYLQQGTAYIVEQNENSIFLLNNSFAFTLRPQDLGSKTPYVPFKRKSQVISTSKSQSSNQSLLQDPISKNKSNTNLNSTLTIRKDAKLNFQSFPIKLVQFKNSHYSYPFIRTSPNFNASEFYYSQFLLKFNRSSSFARVVKVTKGGFLCLMCGVLGFLPKTHMPRFLQVSAKSYLKVNDSKITQTNQTNQTFNTLQKLKSFKHLNNLKDFKGSRKQQLLLVKSLLRTRLNRFDLRPLKTLYSFANLCERNFFLTLPCNFLSSILYPPKTSRSKFQFSFIFTSFNRDSILSERLNSRFKQIDHQINDNPQIQVISNSFNKPKSKNTNTNQNPNQNFLTSINNPSFSFSSTFFNDKFEEKGGKDISKQGLLGKQQKRIITESKRIIK